jgi:hypothetical protein
MERQSVAQFRAETIFDQKTGLYYVEVYYPDNATKPLATTDPIYPTPELAEEDVLEMMRTAFQQPAKVTKRS